MLNVMSISKDHQRFENAQDLIRRGQTEKAAKLLRDIKPKSDIYPHATYALGTLYMQQGLHRQAEITFLSLLKRFPDHADSWRNLGLTRYYGLYQPIEAADAFIQALKYGADPGKIKTYLGLIALHMNDPERAVALFNEALAIYPTDLLLINSKGQACLLLHDFESAKTCVMQALEQDPASVASGYNALLLADVLPQDEKRSIWAHLKTVSTAPEIRLYLDILKADAIGDYVEALDLCSQVISQNTQLMTRVAFLKANLHRKLGETAAAWEAYVQANALEKSLAPSIYIDRSIYLRELKTLAQTPTPEWAAQILAFHEDQPPKCPAFIVGFPRSGTTLTGSILNAHPDCLVTDENAALNAVIEHFVSEMGLTYPADLPKLTTGQRETLRDLYWREHRKHPLWKDTTLFCDKFPLNIVHIGLIAALFPHAKIIYVQRHPADSVLSAFMQDFQPNAAMVLTQDIKECAALYQAVRKAYMAQQEVLSFPVHVLKYERLVSDFDGEVKALLAFLGLEWDERLRAFNRQGQNSDVRTLTPSRKQVEKGLYMSALNRWKKYEAYLAPVLPDLLRESKAMGYD